MQRGISLLIQLVDEEMNTSRSGFYDKKVAGYPFSSSTRFLFSMCHATAPIKTSTKVRITMVGGVIDNPIVLGPACISPLGPGMEVQISQSRHGWL
jgi:hypothetical protein